MSSLQQARLRVTTAAHTLLDCKAEEVDKDTSVIARTDIRDTARAGVLDRQSLALSPTPRTPIKDILAPPNRHAPELKAFAMRIAFHACEGIGLWAVTMGATSLMPHAGAWTLCEASALLGTAKQMRHFSDGADIMERLVVDRATMLDQVPAMEHEHLRIAARQKTRQVSHLVAAGINLALGDVLMLANVKNLSWSLANSVAG